MLESRKFTYEYVKKLFKKYGKFYTTPYSMNIFGIRNSSKTPNKFDDYIGIVYTDGSNTFVKMFKATTDPGLYWLNNPMNVGGTAILLPGYYPGLWKVGLHKGLPALIQAKPCKVIRDSNRDSILDFDSTKTEVGMFGIDCHRANPTIESTEVNKWSAGCQVVANPQKFTDELLIACNFQITKLKSNSFSYLLLREQDLI